MSKVKEVLDRILKDKEIKSLDDLVKKVNSLEEEEDVKKEFNTENIENYIKDLNYCAEEIQTKYEFKKGDLIEWKPKLNNKRWPKKNQPAIVLEVLEEPIIDSSKESSSPYYREPLDLIIGFIFDDGVFISFYVNSKRYRPFVLNKSN